VNLALLTLAAVAKQLGVSDRQVRRFIADPQDPLPVVQLSARCRRVDPVDLDAWICRRRQAQPAPPPGLFGGFSEDARQALEELFCTRNAPRLRQVRENARVTR
jgi:hypothetical protein